MGTILGSLFLLTGLFILANRRIKNGILLLSLQAFFLSALAFYQGLSLGMEAHILFIALLTLVIKVGVLPLILFRLVTKLKAESETPAGTGPVLSFIAGVLIVGLTYGYIVPVLLQGIDTEQHLLASAVSTIFFGCFYVVSRRCVINQVLGIIIMENGLFLSALAITGGMPLIIELGIFFDVLVGVLVMGAIAIKISDSFQSLDINHLRKLRG